MKTDPMPRQRSSACKGNLVLSKKAELLKSSVTSSIRTTGLAGSPSTRVSAFRHGFIRNKLCGSGCLFGFRPGLMRYHLTADHFRWIGEQRSKIFTGVVCCCPDRFFRAGAVAEHVY